MQRSDIPQKLVCSITFILLIFLYISPAEANCIYGQPLSGSSSENGNVISWSTLSEENNDFFVIERSTDGIHFETAAEIDGAGKSMELKQYRFLDINSKHTKTFYRLLQVDFDGQTGLTHTIIVYKSKEDQVFSITALSATATERYFSMTLESKLGSDLSYEVIDTEGKVLKTGAARIIKGVNAISIDLESLAVGAYQLAVSVDQATEILNIKKLDGPEVPKINLANKGRNK
ncbi:MAG: hypothetical protein AAFP19_13600 [Bacteroidota bacterium]